MTKSQIPNTQVDRLLVRTGEPRWICTVERLVDPVIARKVPVVE